MRHLRCIALLVLATLVVAPAHAVRKGKRSSSRQEGGKVRLPASGSVLRIALGLSLSQEVRERVAHGQGDPAPHEFLLKTFAAQRHAADYTQWPALGLIGAATTGGPDYPKEFQKVMGRVMARKGTVVFNLTMLDVQQALAKDAVGATSHELQQIVHNPQWFARTTFFLDGRPLTKQQVRELGVVPPSQGGRHVRRAK
ncbi:MAG: hypothetical protein IT371_20825 [Deltaproteobacteria bacterium]|nr:hypothetical protein [Deltaproteobacteria bacterium]